MNIDIISNERGESVIRHPPDEASFDTFPLGSFFLHLELDELRWKLVISCSEKFYGLLRMFSCEKRWNVQPRLIIPPPH